MQMAEVMAAVLVALRTAVTVLLLLARVYVAHYCSWQLVLWQRQNPFQKFSTTNYMRGLFSHCFVGRLWSEKTSSLQEAWLTTKVLCAIAKVEKSLELELVLGMHISGCWLDFTRLCCHTLHTGTEQSRTGLNGKEQQQSGHECVRAFSFDCSSCCTWLLWMCCFRLSLRK